MINWSNYTWLTQERWGQIHGDKTEKWFDESAVQIDENGYLHLLTHYNPKLFQLETGPVVSPMGIGLVSCTSKEFHYGTYEIEAKLPHGVRVWPAFWMWGWDSWPPEIDIFEGYTGKDGTYKKLNPLYPYNVQTNVHYEDLIHGGNKMIRGRRPLFMYKNPQTNFIKYRLEWTEDHLKFYYNNQLVRYVHDPHIMVQLSISNMNVVINNSIVEYIDPLLQTSDFIIKYFKYTPL